MIRDGNIPKGSKLLSNKEKKGHDYIRTPDGQIIFFSHKFNNKVLDEILKGNYRISQATFNPKRDVVEVKIKGKWKKLEPEISKPKPLDLIGYYWDYLEFKGLKYYVYLILILFGAIYFLQMFSSIFTLFKMGLLTTVEIFIIITLSLVFLFLIILSCYKFYRKKR